MPHSGFGATLNPVPLKNLPPTQVLYFRHAKFFLLNDLYPPIMNICGSGYGPSAVVYHALRNFLIDIQISIDISYNSIHAGWSCRVAGWVVGLIGKISISALL